MFSLLLINPLSSVAVFPPLVNGRVDIKTNKRRAFNANLQQVIQSADIKVSPQFSFESLSGRK